MRLKSGFPSLLSCLAVLAFTMPALAQSTAALRGLVTDAQGGALPGAAITIRNQATGEERTTVSDRPASTAWPALTPGLYRLEVRMRRLPAPGGHGPPAGGRAGRRAERAPVRRQPDRGGRRWSARLRSSRARPRRSAQVISERTVQEIPLNGRHFVDLGLLIPGSVAPQQNGLPDRAPARPGLVRVQHRGQPRGHRELHDQRRST